MIKLAISPASHGGWIPCNGAEVATKDYPELFAKLGTRFGGNGKATFNLPHPTSPPHGFYMIRAKAEGEDAEKFVGLVSQMVLWPLKKLPSGWLPCDGREVKGADYPLLQKLAGNGLSSTPDRFNLPVIPEDAGVQCIICVEGRDPNEVPM